VTDVSGPLVLVVDDEPRILRLVSITLESEGFRVETATSGEDALAAAGRRRPDLVLLDVVLPDVDGIEVMARLRAGHHVPVILVSARGSTLERLRGLDLGADDYIAKPFRPDDLVARVHAVLERIGPPGRERPTVLRVGALEIDLARRVVRRAGDPIQLGRTEWLLLGALAAHAGEVVPTATLLTGVWGPEYREDEAYLRVWINRLRRRLGGSAADPEPIVAVEGGYRFGARGPDAGPAR
jgi:two-component system KDP operon response regulator KdpE